MTLYICVIARHSWQQVVFLQPEAFVNRQRLCSEFLVSCCLLSSGPPKTHPATCSVCWLVFWPSLLASESVSAAPGQYLTEVQLRVGILKYWRCLTQTALKVESMGTITSCIDRFIWMQSVFSSKKIQINICGLPSLPCYPYRIEQKDTGKTFPQLICFGDVLGISMANFRFWSQIKGWLIAHRRLGSKTQQ